MIGTNVSIDKTDDLGEKVTDAVRRGMRDAADAGFAKSQEEAPADRGTLLQSGIPPKWVGDTLWWGYVADYSLFVEKGTAPHWAPIEPLQGWARRVLGDESAAWAVQRKIASEGTDAQPFVEPGIEAMVQVLRKQGLTPRIEDNL